MSASRLSIYNDALLYCGERALASLTENREPRRLLDQVWNNNGVENCLEEGQWHFAMRAVQVDYDPDIEPDFGYLRAFTKPDDWIVTAGLCSDEFFRVPLTRYIDEADYWYAELDTIYVRYVSDDNNYGMNFAGWPRTFAEFVAAHFAYKIIFKLSNDEKRVDSMLRLREKLKRVAKSKCAMAEPTSFPAQGSWSRSRVRGVNRSDGGNTGGNLTG